MAGKQTDLGVRTVNGVLDQLDASVAGLAGLTELSAAERNGLAPVPERLRSTATELAAGLVRDRPARSSELIATLIVRLIGWTDELNRRLPDRQPVPLGRQPMGYACRRLARILQDSHPGRTIEVRIPPYAAVQCGIGPQGPTHTRGTPPNVVETDPVTFLRLATGRLDWAAARTGGLLTASGTRADLSAVLPLQPLR